MALVACASSQPRLRAGALSRTDALWLNRITYGVNSQTLTDFAQRGRAAFLSAQLADTAPALPAPIAAQINILDVTHADATQLLAATNAEYKRINSMSDGPEKEDARKALGERGNELTYEAARRELLACGARPRRAMLTGRDALTPSELRIAELAAGGESNRDIAQALFITPKTVENHLGRIYKKLSIRSREELPKALAADRSREEPPEALAADRSRD